MVDTLTKYIEENIIQGLIALGLLITICYLWIAGQPVPDGLYFSFAVVLGYYFGSETQKVVMNNKINRMGYGDR